MSAMRPQSKRKQPNVRLYADTTHCSRESGMSKCRPIVGRTMTTAWPDTVCKDGQDQKQHKNIQGNSTTYVQETSSRNRCHEGNASCLRKGKSWWLVLHDIIDSPGVIARDGLIRSRLAARYRLPLLLSPNSVSRRGGLDRPCHFRYSSC